MRARSTLMIIINSQCLLQVRGNALKQRRQTTYSHITICVLINWAPHRAFCGTQSPFELIRFDKLKRGTKILPASLVKIGGFWWLVAWRTLDIARI
jgi:hypothetical protein